MQVVTGQKQRKGKADQNESSRTSDPLRPVEAVDSLFSPSPITHAVARMISLSPAPPPSRSTSFTPVASAAASPSPMPACQAVESGATMARITRPTTESTPEIDEGLVEDETLGVMLLRSVRVVLSSPVGGWHGGHLVNMEVLAEQNIIVLRKCVFLDLSALGDYILI